MGLELKINDHTKKISKQLDKNMRTRFTDVVLDLKRISSQSAPHDTGHLEKNKHTIKQGSGSMHGEVWFEATNNGFDYAEWTHEKSYKLGKQSERKARGKSKYASGSVPVGRGFLRNAVELAEDGYIEHIADGFKQSLKGK